MRAAAGSEGCGVVLRASWHGGGHWLELAVAPIARESPTALAARLGPGPRARARRLATAPRRAEFLAGQGLLAELLAGRGETSISGGSGAPPRALVNGAPVAVSLSHAAGQVAAAASSLPALGLDLEHPRPRVDLRRAGRRLGWPELPPGLDPVEAWTLWEARGKAQGRGVFRGADPVVAALVAAAGRHAGEPVTARGWCWHRLALADGLRLSLVHPQGGDALLRV